MDGDVAEMVEPCMQAVGLSQPARAVQQEPGAKERTRSLGRSSLSAARTDSGRLAPFSLVGMPRLVYASSSVSVDPRSQPPLVDHCSGTPLATLRAAVSAGAVPLRPNCNQPE
jgi:hypothetical protein